LGGNDGAGIEFWRFDSGKREREGIAWNGMGWVGYLIYMEFYVGEAYEIKQPNLPPPD
jgi:hypothetical protein